MKIDFNAPILEWDGQQATNQFQKSVTMEMMVRDVLNPPKRGETREEYMKKGSLLLKICREETPDLDSEEVEMIKNALVYTESPIMVTMQIYHLLDGKPNPFNPKQND